MSRVEREIEPVFEVRHRQVFKATECGIMLEVSNN